MNAQLPPTYQRVQTWLEQGASAEEIARRLGIDPSAVPALIELTRAKSTRARKRRRPPETG